MRPIVSYSDIATDVPQHNKSSPTQQRQKWNKGHSRQPDASKASPNGAASSRKRKHGENEGCEWESRELTHEEIWDDSALINAWDAAMEEYEVCIMPSIICPFCID
jgi:hypothetical protein